MKPKNPKRDNGTAAAENRLTINLLSAAVRASVVVILAAGLIAIKFTGPATEVPAVAPCLALPPSNVSLCQAAQQRSDQALGQCRQDLVAALRDLTVAWSTRDAAVHAGQQCRQDLAAALRDLTRAWGNLDAKVHAVRQFLAACSVKHEASQRRHAEAQAEASRLARALKEALGRLHGQAETCYADALPRPDERRKQVVDVLGGREGKDEEVLKLRGELRAVASREVLTVAWRLERFDLARLEHSRGHHINAPALAVAGLHPIYLKLYPNGHATANNPGRDSAMLAVWLPATVRNVTLDACVGRRCVMAQTVSPSDGPLFLPFDPATAAGPTVPQPQQEQAKSAFDKAMSKLHFGVSRVASFASAYLVDVATPIIEAKWADEITFTVKVIAARLGIDAMWGRNGAAVALEGAALGDDDVGVAVHVRLIEGMTPREFYRQRMPSLVMVESGA